VLITLHERCNTTGSTGCSTLWASEAAKQDIVLSVMCPCVQFWRRLSRTIS